MSSATPSGRSDLICRLFLGIPRCLGSHIPRCHVTVSLQLTSIVGGVRWSAVMLPSRKKMFSKSSAALSLKSPPCSQVSGSIAERHSPWVRLAVASSQAPLWGKLIWIILHVYSHAYDIRIPSWATASVHVCVCHGAGAKSVSGTVHAALWRCDFVPGEAAASMSTQCLLQQHQSTSWKRTQPLVSLRPFLPLLSSATTPTACNLIYK